MRAPEAWVQTLDAKDKRLVPAALFGLRYILRHAAPSICMADPGDLETDIAPISVDEQSETGGEEPSTPNAQRSTFNEEKEEPPLVPQDEGAESFVPLPPPAWEEMSFKSALFLYDKLEGGAGYAEKVFEKIAETLELCRRMIRECACENGCPACVPPLPPGVNDEDLELFLVESNAVRVCTLSYLDALIDGVIAVPEVKVITRDWEQRVIAPKPDSEAIRLREKLNRAADALREKRKREY